MKNNCFEIKVALLGNVSAGKTTVLNALLGDKFGEVSMKRTTTCANYFRIHSKSGSEKEWPITPENPRNAKSTCKEIIEDNQVKITKGMSVLEKYFDIDLDLPLIPCRDDTRIVLVDLPGINEAGTDNEYKEYVSCKWTTYDCVVIVMDGKQGVNTDEQVFVLNFVKQNLDKKEVPIIVLFNKVDEPDDEDQIELLSEAEKEFKKIFNEKKDIFFLRISALQAYIYESGSRMSKERFIKFEESLLEKLGRDHLGRKHWSELSPAAKTEEAFRIVNDKRSVKQALRASNFDNFLHTLRTCLGGTKNQLKILEKQMITNFLQIASFHPYESEKVFQNVKFCCKIIKQALESSRIDKHLSDLDESFWIAYKKYENDCFQKFQSEWPKKLDVQILARPMEEIVKYFEHLVESNLDGKCDWFLETVKYDQIRERAKTLFLRFVYFAAAKHNDGCNNTFWSTYLKYNGSNSDSILLSPMDWYLIWSSMLIPLNSSQYDASLVEEKILLESLQKDAYFLTEAHSQYECMCCLRRLKSNSPQCDACKIRYLYDGQIDYCVSCGSSYKLDASKKCTRCAYQCVFYYGKWFVLKYKEDGTFVPVDPDNFNKLVHVNLPDSLDNPNHFGHIPHKYCQLMERIDIVFRDAKRTSKQKVRQGLQLRGGENPKRAQQQQQLVFFTKTSGDTGALQQQYEAFSTASTRTNKKEKASFQCGTSTTSLSYSTTKKTCVEIKIALLGNVSTGKTTVLNALLGDKYGEVAMKRTTACANYFRIHTKSCSVHDWPTTTGHLSAESTCQEITQDNKIKISKGQSVTERYFDIEQDYPLFPCQADTRIVLVDLPGINEAGTDNEYKEYVSSKWTTFDCVVIVMDGKQGVNTDEQVFVLNFVKQNLGRKEVPVIVLFNKVDEPDDADQLSLLKEAEKEFRKIFYTDHNAVEKKNITFLRISALHAYIYQRGSRMSKEQFTEFDQSLLEKLGRDHLGWMRWNKLSQAEKIDEAFRIVRNQDILRDALQVSNFSNFLCTLRNFLGGEENRRQILNKQIIINSLNAMSCSPYVSENVFKSMKVCWTSIKKVFESHEFDRHLTDLDISFWVAYKNYENDCFQKVQLNWPKQLDVQLLAKPLEEIVKYFEYLVANNLDDNCSWFRGIARYEQIRERAKNLVLRFIYYVSMVYSNDNITSFLTKYCKRDESPMLSPMAWHRIWISMLLPSKHKRFLAAFGKEKILIERLVKRANFRIERRSKIDQCLFCFNNLSNGRCDDCRIVPVTVEATTCFKNCNSRYSQYLDSSKKCPQCSYQYVMVTNHTFGDLFARTYKEDGTVVPLNPNIYNMFVHTSVPGSLDDPNHFGHLAYKYCQLVDQIDLHLFNIQNKVQPTNKSIIDRRGTTSFGEENTVRPQYKSVGTQTTSTTTKDQSSKKIDIPFAPYPPLAPY